jgi:uncharacterized protein (TIGR03790 family)
MRLASALLLIAASSASAIGPQNVLVLARADSPDSLRIANAYLAARRIPVENLVLLPYRDSPHHCTFDVFERDVMKPARKAIEERKLDKTIHVWATTLGLPWRVDKNGVSGVVHFGRAIEPKKAPLLGPAGFTDVNRYAGVWLSIDAFGSLPNADRRPLHMHVAAGSVESTLAMIQRSAAADGTFPTGTFYLCDGAGPRASRKGSIAQAIPFLRALGARIEHLPVSQFVGKRDVMGLFTGDIRFPTDQNTFLPGALADHLTSTGGVLDGTGGQMMCTAFLDAGCSASYGTVVEPYNYPMKFPAALVHAAYRAGFTAVESYWMSVLWPQQGVFVGDPLARPFGKAPTIAVSSPSDGQAVADAAPLQLQAVASKGGVGGIEVRLDGLAVAGVGQQRLPAGASITLKLGDKRYDASATTPTVLATLFGDLKKKLEADGYDVAATAASLMIHRNAAGPPPSATLLCTSPALHGEVVGGKFIPVDAASGKGFLWLRFSTGPQSATARLRLPIDKTPDGLHPLRFSAVSGDETTASASHTVNVVKRTRESRVRLKRLRERLPLTASRTDVAEASFEGTGLAPPIEFRVDGRVVEARLKPPFTLSVDPKALGVGRHTIRARTTAPTQEADDELEFHIDP